jgi:hypothetical protein
VNKERVCLISAGVVYIAVVAVAAYFDYHSYVGAGAVLAGFLLATMLMPTILVSTFPFVGALIQGFISLALIELWSFATRLPAATLTVSAAFWLAVLPGAAVCLATTLLFLTRL